MAVGSETDRHARPVIVSASYNDDIPAFYGRWFMKRMDAGYCRTFDSHGLQFHRVPLTREAVEGFVFWTRNARPFLQDLEEVRRRGFPFIVHYGITGESENAVRNMRELAKAYGQRSIVWRYEPIAATAQTPLAWHAQMYESLAHELKGTTDEVVVVFAEPTSEPQGRDGTEEKRSAVKRMAAIAAACGMRISLCSQPDYLVPGTSPARCIDARRLSDIAHRQIAAETRARWSGCLCAAARDIGVPLAEGGFVRGAALAPRRENHDENGEFLVPPPAQFAELDGAELPF